MKEQKKREKKYNNGFFRWLIIEYLRVFISILSGIMWVGSIIIDVIFK
jgi:hypothetical protein